MRTFSVFMAVLFAFVVFDAGACTTAQAQWWPGYYPPGPPPEYQEHKVTIGLWQNLGVQGKLGPGIRPVGIYTGGVYAELSHVKLRPAIEVRGTYAPDGVQGTLVGPRVAWKVDNAVFYVSGLVGPNHYIVQSFNATSFQPTTTDFHGVTGEVAGGLELMSRYHPNWGVRVDASSGKFTGHDQSFPLTVSAGIVLRVP